MASRTDSAPTTPSLIQAGRSSPPPACAICLGQFQNKSFTETCLHQFCFKCLLEWSKIKAECPLCKQPFNAIIHSVQPNNVYDKYVIRPPEPPNDLEFTSEIMYSRRFRYRTTLTLHSHENIAMQRLFDSLPTESSLNLSRSMPAPNPEHFRNRITHSIIFRRRIYNQNMWAHPLPDITGRFRDCSPEIYRNNNNEVNRLVPWITRELSALLVDPTSISYALNEIITKLQQHAIRSRAFKEFISTYVPVYTDQFIHELYQFATSPFDIRGYDQFVSYGVGNPVIVDSYVNEISSSEENSTDSDVLFVTPGPITINPTINSDAALSEPSTSFWDNSRSLGCPVVIESIRQSDTDESSDEVVLVMCKKPPHERTPEIVDLVASDSDAIIIEEPRSTPTVSNNLESSDQLPSLSSGPSTSKQRSLFKRRLSWSTCESENDSEDNTQQSTNKNSLIRNILFRRYAHKSRKVNSTEGTDRDTDSYSSSSSSSSRSNSPVNLMKTPNTGANSNESSQLDKNHDNKIIKTIFSKIATSQSGSNQESSYPKKFKHKKSKHKKRTKKSYKHKTKSKKISKNKDKPTEKQYKGKFCYKSKAKNKLNPDLLNEAFSPLEFKMNFDSDSYTSSQEIDLKKKTLKSVVTTVPSADSEVKTNLLDLMNIAVLSSNTVLSIKNKDSNVHEETTPSKESTSSIPNSDSTDLQDSG